MSHRQAFEIPTTACPLHFPYSNITIFICNKGVIDHIGGKAVQMTPQGNSNQINFYIFRRIYGEFS
jgi:hypothetical protein